MAVSIALLVLLFQNYRVSRYAMTSRRSRSASARPTGHGAGRLGPTRNVGQRTLHELARGGPEPQLALPLLEERARHD